MKAETPCLEREKIFGLVHHLLEPAEEAEARRHVFKCAACRRVAQDFERFDAALGEWKEEIPSPWFDRRLKQQLAASRPPSAYRIWGLPATRLFAAALLVLVVVAGAYVIHELPQAGKKVAQPQAAKVQPRQPSRPLEPTPAPELSLATPPSKPLPPEEELKLYQNLAVLENFDMLENFDVLSELPKGDAKVAD